AALRVGIAWSGNRQMGHDADRSPPGLSTFAPLFDVAGVQWQGLTPDAAMQEEERRHGISPLPPVRDLADTAAILRQLDLVVTVDSVVANLAPAVGVPTWIFPTTIPEPRWPMGHARSPWFPLVRPFRRARLSAWDAAVQAAARALAERVTRGRDDESPGDERR
ncbi:MAG TPA: hypothetical protein VFV33_13485, partial [Gemmatimonadaceae bacterium]|nr:hypothetical protein [Gemmatimonadaceae bacterium]